MRLLMIIFLSLTACEDKPTDGNSSIEAQNLFSFYALSETEGKTFHETVDHVRKFVHDNSRHPHDPSPYPTAEVEAYANAVNLFIQGEGDKPILYCGHRARLLISVLERAGIKGRLVQLITEYAGSIEGHVFAEVYNPSTNQWEISDPDFNLFYSDGSKRLSLKDILTQPLNTFAPCRASVCDWNLPADQDWFDVSFMTSRNYFVSGRIQSTLSQRAHVYSNADRFDVHAPRRSLNGKSVLQYYSLDMGGTWEDL